MLVSIISGLLLAASPSPEGTRLSVSVEGARTDPLQRWVWAHEPSEAPFPQLSPGFGGGVSVELGMRLPNVRWLGFSIGARGRLGTWRGSTLDEAASLWDLGLRSRIEALLGPFVLWGGIGTSLGNAVARTGGVERQVVVHGIDFGAGLRVRVLGPLAFGLFVETLRASSIVWPREEFSTLRIGLDLTFTFELGAPTREPAAR